MILRLVPIALAGLLSLGCAATPTVLHQGDATFERSMQTYVVKYHPVGSDVNTRHIFESVVHDAMNAKGYLQAKEAEADMVVNFKALTKSEANAESGTSAQLNGASAAAEEIDKVVMVTIERRSTDEVLWVGWSTGAYADEEILPMTKKAVTAILALLPSRVPSGQPEGPTTSPAG